MSPSARTAASTTPYAPTSSALCAAARSCPPAQFVETGSRWCTATAGPSGAGLQACAWTTVRSARRHALAPKSRGVRYRSARHRGVAQPGSAPDWGSGGRRFKSCRPDHTSQSLTSAATPAALHFAQVIVPPRRVRRQSTGRKVAPSWMLHSLRTFVRGVDRWKSIERPKRPWPKGSRACFAVGDIGVGTAGRSSMTSRRVSARRREAFRGDRPQPILASSPGVSRRKSAEQP